MTDVFTVEGYEETLLQIDTNKVLGTRRYTTLPAGRKTGIAGAEEFDMKGDHTLNRGHKTKLYRFHAPVKVLSVFYPINGRMVNDR